MRTIDLPFKLKKPVLACGADLKGAFAIAEGASVFLFEGFGDLAELNNLTRYEKAVKTGIKRLKISPEIVACDLHPGYFSTQFAETWTMDPGPLSLYKIQHHEAHIASAIIDNSIKGDVIGVAFDGTGYGFDGNIWGGEFFIGDLRGFKRVAHFEYMPMPGGDAAIKEPWRMAVSFLYRTFGRAFLDLGIDFVKKLDKRDCAILKTMIDKNLNSPLTSSAGRLFDAVASLVLSKNNAAFEAELPVELEKAALELCQDRYDFGINPKKGVLAIDYSKTFKEIVKDIKKKTDKSIISAKFHNTVAGAILQTTISLRKKFKANKVVLSGGVFQNKFLTARASALLKRSGFNVYTHSGVSTNDSGIPIGQVAIAGARCA